MYFICYDIVVSFRLSFEEARLSDILLELYKITACDSTNSILETKTDMFLKLSLSILLHIVVMAMAFSSNCLVPFHYDLKLKLESRHMLKGESNITVSINCATQNITFHVSTYITIMKINLISVESGKIYTPKYIKNFEDGTVVLNFDHQLWPVNNFEYEAYIVNIEFLNFITDQHISNKFSRTWYINKNEDEKWMIATLNQPKRARELFPCLDEPELSATFNITIEHERIYRAMSNMLIQEFEDLNTTIITYFHTTPSISPNDVTIIIYEIGQMYPVLDSTVIRTWCRKHLTSQMKFMQSVAENVTIYLMKNWDIIKSVQKVDYIAIPNFEDKIWQTWGFVFYNETDLIYKEDNFYSVTYETTFRLSIAHDIIYEWFGELFNPSCRCNEWLNKGFIKFLEIYIVDKAFPNSRMMDLFVVQATYEFRRLNNYYAKSAINNDMKHARDMLQINPFLTFPHIGAIYWRSMLESVIISHDLFWIGIKTYLKSKFTSFNLDTPDNLWNIMQNVKDKRNPRGYNLNVKRIMDAWAAQDHFPVLLVTRNYTHGRATISREKVDRIPYFIPFTYTTKRHIDFNISLPNISYCLTESKPEFRIDVEGDDKWLIVNIQQTGYYSVYYDAENWQRIASHLNTTNYTDIHVLNRAQLVHDAFQMALEKKLDFPIFWEVANYLRLERNYLGWYPMFRIFELISNIFPYSNYHFAYFREVLNLTRTWFEQIEEKMYDQMAPTNNNLDKYFKQELAKWGCLLDNPSCMHMAARQLELYLHDSEKNKILPGWQKWTYCNGLKYANMSVWVHIWQKAFRRYKEKSDPKMLEFLSCSENPEIIVYYLSFLLKTIENSQLDKIKHKTLTQEEEHKVYALTTNIFLSTLARHATNYIIIERISKFYEIVKHSRINMIVIITVVINNVYYIKSYEEVYEFALKNMPPSYLPIVEEKLKERHKFMNNHLDFLQSLYQNIERRYLIRDWKIKILDIFRNITGVFPFYKQYKRA